MGYVKKELLVFISDNLESIARKAQRDLMDNKYAIQKLSRDQYRLKKKASEAMRLAENFKKQAKLEERGKN